jgi:hypothetical protein
MDSLVNQFSDIFIFNIDQYIHKEIIVNDNVLKTWTLKGETSNDFFMLRLNAGKWSTKKLFDQTYHPVYDITAFLTENKSAFENYKNHCDLVEDLISNIEKELKCQPNFNNFTFAGWNFFSKLTIRIDKYNFDENTVIFQGKTTIMTSEKLLKFILKNKKQMISIIKEVPEIPVKIDNTVQRVPLTFEERHQNMLRANAIPYKNHMKCMFLKRPLYKRFKAQACKEVIDTKQDPEYLAFMIEKFTI